MFCEFNQIQIQILKTKTEQSVRAKRKYYYIIFNHVKATFNSRSKHAPINLNILWLVVTRRVALNNFNRS